MRNLIIAWAVVLLCMPARIFAQTFEEKMKGLVVEACSADPESYGLQLADLQSAGISAVYTSTHNQVTHVYLQQQHQGIGLRDAVLSAHVAGGKVVKVSHRFLSNLSAKINTISPGISSEVALNKAAAHVQLSDYSRVILEERATGLSRKTSYRVPGLSNEIIPVQLSFVPVGSQARLAWLVRIYTTNYAHWWGIWVDALNGTILAEEDWVVTCNWGHAHSHSHAGQLHQHSTTSELMSLYHPFRISAIPEYHVFDRPVESPNHGTRSIVIDPSDGQASPFGWHDIDGIEGEEFTITRGNNVWAQDDQNGDNGTGFSPDGGSNLSFDFPLPAGVPPASYLEASTVNLFYWNNLIHDVMYQYGFDEVAGNFQANNYGKGGLEGDFVFADAQDGSGLNNANFATPPDGTSGRMQMFLWATGGANIDLVTINSPASIAGTYEGAESNFGPGIPASGITADLVLVTDTSGTSDACSDITNGSAIAGKIAILDRGNCSFAEKVERAQNQGALAVIIVNNQPNGLFAPGGFGVGITIPSLMVRQADGALFKTALATGPVTLTLANPGNPNDKDGSLDNGIIAHEYGHGISTRLTGGPAVSCLSNQEQPGEGWSDFFSLIFTTDSSNQGEDIRGIGTFAFGQPTDGVGIRDYPYSTNLFASPYTYDDIKTLSIPHGVGSVMCAMLWDMYWAFVDQYGFDDDIYNGTGGNNMAIQLVIDGMKLQSCSPGFTDVRDAIILADQLNNGGANNCLIWDVFARRGLGYSADQGDPDNRSDGTEAFDIPPSCQKILYMEKKTESVSVPAGQNVTYQFAIKNQKDSTLTQVTMRDTLPEPLVFVQGSASCPVSLDGNRILTIVVDTLLPGEEITCQFDAHIPLSSDVSVYSYEDDLEGNTSSYLPAAQVGQDGWVIDTTNPYSGQVAWFIPNVEADNDQTLSFPLPALTSPAVFSFWHQYNTEAGWDGGVVEVLPTITGGGTWFDLGPFMLKNGYNTSLGTNNPLGAVNAFSGSSGEYIKTTIDLSGYLNQPLFIRFRFVSDNNTAVEGWWVDDIRLGIEETFRNTACVTSAEGDAYCTAQEEETLITGSENPTQLDQGRNLREIRLAPNPADEGVTVSWFLNQPESVSVVLRNLMGQEIISESVGADRQRVQIPLSGIPSGVYLVEVSSASGRSYIRLAVE